MDVLPQTIKVLISLIIILLKTTKQLENQSKRVNQKKQSDLKLFILLKNTPKPKNILEFIKPLLEGKIWG
jgi:hypothetical protein